MFTKAFIPYRGYYSSPFAKWQGTLAGSHPVKLAGATVQRWMAERGWDPAGFDYVNLGLTIPQPHIFYGGSWAAAVAGCDGVPGMWISQACSTGTTCLHQAALGIEAGEVDAVLNLMADRTSNGPHTIWPNPQGAGGQVDVENWMADNFNADPWAGERMIVTAEMVAADTGITREECDAVALRRYEQYTDALRDDRRFQKGYMRPLEVAVSRKMTLVVEADEGIFATTAEGLAALKPVIPDGVHTFGAQTHPADGNAAIIVTTRERARELAPGGPEIQVLSYGFAREKKCYMAAAPVPAARMALERAGLPLTEVKAIKTHNPFAANDVYMAKAMDLDVMGFNNYGSPIVFGHPQGPTAGRCVIELIEELVGLGGGHGLFTGCAAGDTGAALIVRVG